MAFMIWELRNRIHRTIGIYGLANRYPVSDDRTLHHKNWDRNHRLKTEIDEPDVVHNTSKRPVLGIPVIVPIRRQYKCKAS